MTGTIRLSRRELSLAATACSVQAAELDTLLTLPPPDRFGPPLRKRNARSGGATPRRYARSPGCASRRWEVRARD